MLAGLSWADAPTPEQVQGLYEGACKTAQGDVPAEARLVALGKGSYKLLVRQKLADGKTGKAELAGTTEKDAIRFAGKGADAAWSGTYADGVVKGTCGQDATFEVKRVVRLSPTLGAKAPEGAVVLLDGKNFDEVVMRGGGKGPATQPAWKLMGEGAVEVPKGGITSKRSFTGSFNLHVEFMNPFMPTASGQGRGNSGVFLPNGDEIQVLDSFGMTTYKGGGCGGLYKYKDPDAFDEFSLASAPPLQWQTYDIEYRLEMKDGKPTGKARLTVLHNGIKIHDNAELGGKAKGGAFFFQDHGNPVQYRNMWVQVLDGK
jgi:hypothetical protein